MINSLLKLREKANKKSHSAKVKAEWESPVQKHVDEHGNDLFTTISVRIYSNNLEQNYKFKFASGRLKIKNCLKAISDRLGIDQQNRCLFGLWIVSRDLELQLHPELDILEFLKNWHLWVTKYTHFHEAIDPSHPVSRFLIVFRREASATLARELDAVKNSEVIRRLFFGECRTNLLNGRFPYSKEDIVKFAGLELQAIKDFTTTQYPEFLLSQERWTFLIPKAFHGLMPASKWVELIRKEHEFRAGLNEHEARICYVEYAQTFPFHGSSFFTCCEIPPPAGYFELRLDNFMIGINSEFVTIIDKTKNVLLSTVKIDHLLWRTTKDTIKFKFPTGPSKKLISPMVTVMNNLLVNLVQNDVKMQVDHQMESTLSLNFPKFNRSPVKSEESRPSVSSRKSRGSISNVIISVNEGLKRESTTHATRKLSIAHRESVDAAYGKARISTIGRQSVSSDKPHSRQATGNAELPVECYSKNTTENFEASHLIIPSVDELIPNISSDSSVHEQEKK